MARKNGETDVIRYLVKTKGYKETFESIESAKNQFEVLKKRAIKNQNNLKIELFEKSATGMTLIDEVRITEAFYEE